MKISPKIIFGSFIALLISVLVAIIISPNCAGLDAIIEGAGSARGDSQPVNLFGNNGVFTQISGSLLFLVGSLSVFMLIIGGVRFVISGGSASAISGAKNTILYAIVGIVVSIAAYGAIEFVLSSLLASGTENI